MINYSNLHKNKISIAPMIAWTDRHYRYLMRLITKKTMLYTEMISLNSLVYRDRFYQLDFEDDQNNTTIQFGGNIPKDFAYGAKLAQEYGYKEVNINIGCPSARVQKGNFGLSLMAEPQLVADCVRAIKEEVDISISVKCRIGYDKNDSYGELYKFVEAQKKAGADFVCIHARKGWLNGLSPKDNRTTPPLKYDIVYAIKRDFPNLAIGINGGVQSLKDAKDHLKIVDSVMIGREAYNNPMIFKDVDEIFYNQVANNITPLEVANAFVPYIKQELENGIKISNILKHTLNLFNGNKNARAYRRFLSENMYKKDANLDIYLQALEIF